MAKNAVIGFPTRGRKRQFLSIFATQRPHKLALDARAEFLNRLVGMTFENDDLEVAAKMFGISRSETVDFNHKMRTMEAGNFFAFGRAICVETTLLKVGPVETSHEIQSAKHGFAAPPTPEKIKRLLPQLADLPKEAEEQESDLAASRTKIKELERALAAAQREAPPAKVENKPIITAEQQKALDHLSALVNKHCEQQLAIITAVQKANSEYQEISAMIKNLKASIETALRIGIQINMKPAPPIYQRQSAVVAPRASVQQNGEFKLSIGDERILALLIQFPAGLNRAQITVLAGYARSTRDEYLKKMFAKLIVTEPQRAFVRASENLF